MAEGADNKENTESKADAAVKAGIKDTKKLFDIVKQEYNAKNIDNLKKAAE